MPSELRPVTGRQPAPDTDQPDAEIRMRRALGLEPSVKEAVVRRSGSPAIARRDNRNFEPQVNRGAEAEASLAAERLAREQAETMLRKAEAALHETETRRGHAELARDEALAALASERSAREAAEEQLRRLTSASVSEPAATPRKRGRPVGSRVSKPVFTSDAPVEWWVPGWKTRFGRPG